MSFLEEMFADLWDYHCPDVDLYREIRFAYPRKYRGDFVNPYSKIIIEIQGGTWSNSKMGHNSGRGIQRDAEKIRLAAFLGFYTLPLIDKDIKEETILKIKELIEKKVPSEKETNAYIKTLREGDEILVFRNELFRIEKGIFCKKQKIKNILEIRFKRKKPFEFKKENIILPVNWPSQIYNFKNE